MKNYYHLLSLPRTASTDDIKAAYRKLSVKLHPDQNQGERFFEKFFKEIKDAYDTLADTVKRQRYDWDLDNFLKQRGELSNTGKTEEQFQSHEAILKKEREQFRHKERELIYAAKELQEQFSLFVKKTEQEAKQQAAESAELKGSLRNLWRVLAFFVVISLGLGLFITVNSIRRALPTNEEKQQMAMGRELAATQEESLQKEFWKNLATDTTTIRDAFRNVACKKVAEIGFDTSSALLKKEQYWEVAAIAEFLKWTKKRPIYLQAFCNTEEANVTKLARLRGETMQKELMHLGIRESDMIIEERVEMAAVGGTYPTKKNTYKGRVLVLIPE